MDGNTHFVDALPYQLLVLSRSCSARGRILLLARVRALPIPLWAYLLVGTQWLGGRGNMSMYATAALCLPSTVVHRNAWVVLYEGSIRPSLGLHLPPPLPPARTAKGRNRNMGGKGRAAADSAAGHATGITINPLSFYSLHWLLVGTLLFLLPIFLPPIQCLPLCAEEPKTALGILWTVRVQLPSLAFATVNI